jgi:hypothetical protein
LEAKVKIGASWVKALEVLTSSFNVLAMAAKLLPGVSSLERVSA